MKNKSGPNIEPWGTPAIMLTQSDATHSKRGPVRPTDLNFNNKSSCQTRSNALLISQNVAFTSKPSSNALENVL